MLTYRIHTIASAPEKPKSALEQLDRVFGVLPKLAAAIANSPKLINRGGLIGKSLPLMGFRVILVFDLECGRVFHRAHRAMRRSFPIPNTPLSSPAVHSRPTWPPCSGMIGLPTPFPLWASEMKAPSSTRRRRLPGLQVDPKAGRESSAVQPEWAGQRSLVPHP